ncbi:hypothetical protein FQZ97_897150 [compost metagenome]
MRAATRIDHPRAFFHGIGKQPVEERHLARLGQRRQRHAGIPRHARLELGQLGAELIEEWLQHIFMHEEDLQRRAALAVERQRAGDRFVHRIVQVDLGQDDAGVLRVQAQCSTQAVRAWVQFLQVAGALVGADEGEHIDLATGHQRADRFAATTVDDVDHSGRETVAEGLE